VILVDLAIIVGVIVSVAFAVLFRIPRKKKEDD
jgi:hypothetical protein